MNQFKKDLNYELQSVSLSNEKMQQIATKARTKLHKQKRRINWQYRFVLATFTIFSLGFGYLLLQQGEITGRLQGVAPIKSAPTSNWSILNHDFTKVILLISFFIILRVMIKRRLQRSGKGLPVCVECGEEWSFRYALKQSMKNVKTTCPHCGLKQYRTKKSSQKGAMLTFFMPFIAVVPLLFDNILLGFVVYLSCTAYLLFSLSPYLIELQEKDPSKEPLW